MFLVPSAAGIFPQFSINECSQRKVIPDQGLIWVSRPNQLFCVHVEKRASADINHELLRAAVGRQADAFDCGSDKGDQP
jgi:hypothetical protein